MSFSELLTTYLDGEPSPDELQALAAQLNESSDSRREFRGAMRLHVLAREIAQEEASMPVRFTRAHGWWLSAAAGLLLAVAGSWLYTRQDPQDPAEPEPWDLAWLASVNFADLKQIKQDPGTRYADLGPRIMAKMGRLPDGTEPPPPPKPREQRVREFSEQFGFRVRAPLILPDEWGLYRGRMVSKARAELVYRHRRSLLQVVLWADPGPEVVPFSHPVGEGQAPFTVLRRGGVGLAIRAPEAETDLNRIVNELLPASGAGLEPGPTMP